MGEFDFDSVRKPLTFILILVCGCLLQLKKQTVQHVLGFQQVILSCLLPALLYKAMVNMSLDVTPDPWVFPVVALAYSAVLAAACLPALFLSGFAADRCQRSTLMMMLPGLAPGLTSLPYIEGIVEGVSPHTMTVGHAGLADIGVKAFVLFGLYLAAMWLSARTERGADRALQGCMGSGRPEASSSQRLRMLAGLACQFFTEPVSVSSIVGLILLIAGPVPLSKQPLWGDAIGYLAKCCTPAIFLLIGVKLKCPKQQHLGLLALLVFRSGVALLFVAVLRSAGGMQADQTLFWIFFCSSAVSFWPYTHMVTFARREEMSLRKRCVALLRAVANDDSIPEDAAAELQSAADALADGSSDAAGVLGATSKALSAAPGWGAVARGRIAVEQLQQDGQTFDLPLALMLLTASFTWTIAFCTAVSLAPTDFWMAPGVLPGLGGLLVVAGFVSLVALALVQRRQQQQLATGPAQPTQRRPSINMGRQEVDELTVGEVDAALRRVSIAAFADDDGQPRARRSSVLSAVSEHMSEPRTSVVADWALRSSMVAGAGGSCHHAEPGAAANCKNLAADTRRPSVDSFNSTQHSEEAPTLLSSIVVSLEGGAAAAVKGTGPGAAGQPQTVLAEEEAAVEPPASSQAEAPGSVLTRMGHWACAPWLRH